MPEGMASTGAASVADEDAETDGAEGDEDDAVSGPLQTEPVASAEPAAAPAETAIPSPPRDEPAPANPVDHAEPGPVDR